MQRVGEVGATGGGTASVRGYVQRDSIRQGLRIVEWIKCVEYCEGDYCAEYCVRLLCRVFCAPTVESIVRLLWRVLCVALRESTTLRGVNSRFVTSAVTFIVTVVVRLGGIDTTPLYRSL